MTSAAYESRYWVSYKAAKEKGEPVRKGEKATWIFFWHRRNTEALAEPRQKIAGREPAPSGGLQSGKS